MPHYRAAAEDRGHSIEFHTGDLAGTGPSTLEAMVQRSQLVVVVTDVNSHGAVWQARRLARQYACSLVFVRRLGVARLRELVTTHDPARAQSACAQGA
jgi:hypothetical protein